MSHQGPGNGPPSAGMQHPPVPQVPAAQGAQNLSQQNLNQIVIEYLIKKGYNRTEQTLRAESSQVDKDGRPLKDHPLEHGFAKYSKAYTLIRDWAEGNLDVYKFESSRLLWPMFLYSYIEMILLLEPEAESKKFLATFRAPFEKVHADELQTLETVTMKAHVEECDLTQLYTKNRYRIPLNTHVHWGLIHFLEGKDTIEDGGRTILYLLQKYCSLKETERGPLDQFSFDAILKSRTSGVDTVDQEEGVEGAFTGVSNKDILDNTTQLKLGMIAIEHDLAEDARAELQEEDSRNPPHPGWAPLTQTFDGMVKREDSADGPSRTEIPYPPSRARDVALLVQKVKEYRDRFKIEGRTGGVGPGISVCMYTFHNSMESITCIQISDDTTLVACGFEESYIRVWNTEGKPLPSLRAGSAPVASRRLIGHSAPVYAVSFNPSANTTPNPDESTPSTAPTLLLSCSSDGHIRLWSLQTWTCLIVYKGHDGPVWDVRFSPHGHYFVSSGRDRTVRVWGQDHISPLRFLAGHDTSCNKVAWHPNGAYVFSASDQTDKTVRMWSFVTGDCVRVFSGHIDMMSALECSPSGKILASADNSGCIILWDLAKGTMIKRCRGHKGPIYSLSFSAESTVLVSGGSDGTVRAWDVKLPTDATPAGDGEVLGGGTVHPIDLPRTNAGAASGTQTAAGAAASASGKKKGKDTTITPDQISAFPTKKTPVYLVKFTGMNLVLSAGPNCG